MGKVVTLGEIMLRFSTDAGEKLAQSRKLDVHYGGGEANVAISLANFGHDVTFASRVPDNALGEAVKKHLQRYGVHTQDLLFGGERLGTYYVESGIGERAATVTYDRAYSSFSQMTDLAWNLADLFKDVDIFHISGITPALTPKWREMTVTLVRAAKKAGCKVSLDINYRAKLWSHQEAKATMQELLPYVDYCSAGELDAFYFMDVPKYTGSEDGLTYYYQEMSRRYPNISYFYSTTRAVISASANRLTGTIWSVAEQKIYASKTHDIDTIVDRVGAGDALSGGVLHGILAKQTPQEIIDFGTAAAALKHTIKGDCNQFSTAEVASFLASGSGKIIR